MSDEELAAEATQYFFEFGLNESHELQKINCSKFSDITINDPICDLLQAAILYGIQAGKNN